MTALGGVSDRLLVLSSAVGLRRHAARLDDPRRALCGYKTDGWQITALATGLVNCLRCAHQLRQRDRADMIEPRLRTVLIHRSIVSRQLTAAECANG